MLEKTTAFWKINKRSNVLPRTDPKILWQLGPLLIGAGLMSLTSSCRTTSSGETRPASAPATAGAAMEAAYDMEQADEQRLYLKMLAVELGAGIKVPKDQLHSSRGLVQCHKDGVLETCFLRVRLMKSSLSSTQKLDDDISNKIWAFFRRTRPEVDQENMILGDVICDYIGVKSPPYNKESVDCKIQHPHMSNEAIFEGLVASELAELLRGGRSFGNTKLILHGAVSCAWIEGSERSDCQVRIMKDGMLQEDVLAIRHHIASRVGRGLQQALLDHLNLTDKGSKNTRKVPKQVMANLVCMVNSLKFETSKTRRYLCRATL